MELKFTEGAHCANVDVSVSDDGKEYTLSDVNIADFFDQIMEEEVISEFFADEDTKKQLIAMIGVDTVLKVFERDELLNGCSWEFVKQFFLDNIDVEAVLNHIGFEKVKEHFSDRIESVEESSNDINIDDGPSMMEALNADRGQDSTNTV